MTVSHPIPADRIPRPSSLYVAEEGRPRVRRLVARRLAEDERLVCMERAQLLQNAREELDHLPRVPRQASVLHALCRGITPVVEPGDILAGRMPEILPDAEQEAFVQQHPEFFNHPGVPDWLDSISIFVPDWSWLIREGLGGISNRASSRLDESGITEDQRAFLTAVTEAMSALSLLFRRYGEAARLLVESESSPDLCDELSAMADRCDRVSWNPPESFADALQLMQIVHMALSCLVGGRDITPGRMDQYLWPLYEKDVERGAITRDDAVVLLSLFYLRLSQMSGNGTDFDDNIRRSPCMYSHIYVTVGGADIHGQSCVNTLSYVVADAIRLLGYKEPTMLVRYHSQAEPAFVEKVAGMIADRLPVTVYNDDVVVPALTSQGVPEAWAWNYAHSACHNSIVPGYEAGSGPGGFHNIPKLVLLAMNAGRDPQTGKLAGAPTADPAEIASYDEFLDALRYQMRHLLAGVRHTTEKRWGSTYADACPLLPSSLMELCLERGTPAWQAAPISHLNHYFAGVATVVDSLLAIRYLVFEERSLKLGAFLDILNDNWEGQQILRERIRKRLPRYGQDCEEASAAAAVVGRMWVEEVEAASRGMTRLAMWPGFYSHMYHARQGAKTSATPDGRASGDALSENLAPSVGSPDCTPTTILKAMSHLPLDHTPSGAAILTLPGGSFAGAEGIARLRSLLESYFWMGGHHLHVNAIDLKTLQAALETPHQYGELMVRVAGFSAYFVQLNEDVQQDVIRRHSRAL